jgi:hypothetical protein
VTARLVANPAGRRGSRIACDGAVVIKANVSKWTVQAVM